MFKSNNTKQNNILQYKKYKNKLICFLIKQWFDRWKYEWLIAFNIPNNK